MRSKVTELCVPGIVFKKKLLKKPGRGEKAPSTLSVHAGSPSRGGDVTVYAFDIN